MMPNQTKRSWAEPSTTLVVLVSIVLAVATYIVLWCIAVVFLPSRGFVYSSFIFGPAYFLGTCYPVIPPDWVMVVWVCNVLFFLWHPFLFSALVLAFMRIVRNRCFQDETLGLLMWGEQMLAMKIRRRTILTVTIVALLAVGGAGIWILFGRGARIHRKWKEQSVTELRQLSRNNAWIQEQISTIKGTLKVNRDDEAAGFFTPHLILMKNGEWIAYSYLEDEYVRDLFIGTDGSGKWYYTSFHFCSHMMNMEFWGQPESLASFIKHHSLREFDGHSDECFKKTKTFRVD